MTAQSQIKPQTLRCAIYTRKSSEEGLEQGFNSLDAQFEACAAYIASQRHEGWQLQPGRFDDGGLSAGSMDRPALKRLLAEIDAGRIGMVVVYKIDRLTRSLADFARLVERLEAKGCSFVSVTQAFNTSSSMGRLTLNVLLSFAQFEREVTAERIRDKIAASKKKGLWMGGTLPLGYDPPSDPLKARVLQVNAAEAETVHSLFALYLETGTLSQTRDAALARGLSPRKADHVLGSPVTQVLRPFSNGQLHYLLTNPVYRGLTRHKDLAHPGQHAAIIDDSLWTRVQTLLQSTAARKRRRPADLDLSCPAAKEDTTSGEPVAPLIGRLLDDQGDRMTPSHTNRHNRRYRYYISRRLITEGRDPSAWRLPAPQLEATVLNALRQHLLQRADRHDLLVNPDAQQAQRVSAALTSLATATSAKTTEDNLWPLIAAVRLAAGALTIDIAPMALASRLGLDPADLNPALMTFEHSFERRRSGVETRLVTGNPQPQPDSILQHNLARAHRWAKAIRNGQTCVALAQSEGRSESYVRTRMSLAFLAPTIQRAILSGTIGPEWTTDRLLRQQLPAGWADQIKVLNL